MEELCYQLIATVAAIPLAEAEMQTPNVDQMTTCQKDFENGVQTTGRQLGF